MSFLKGMEIKFQKIKFFRYTNGNMMLLKERVNVCLLRLYTEVREIREIQNG